jgi:flagellar motility protein MotE (MotC chaperone)
MTDKPAKTRKAAVKPAAPAKSAEKPAATRTPTRRRRTPAHDTIAERAYFIQIEEGTDDEVGHWLRAERELKAA